jgi:signal transduction histidine kinase
MQRMSPEKEEWQEFLDTLTQEADHQARLVEDILQISHIDDGGLVVEPRSTSLNELTHTIVASRQMLAQERGLNLEHRLAEPEPVAVMDSKCMMQVLNNLVWNALQYTPEGGKVLVSTNREEAEGRVWATVAVVDTGVGIPEEELPYVFDRFFRGKKPQSEQISGTGLGLAIVKEIVELQGGRVTVDSKQDVGSTFTVWLPLAG